MNEILNIEKFIAIIPDILIYIAPGFIFITLRDYQNSNNTQSDKYVIVKSIVISFLILKLVNIFISTDYYLFPHIILIISILISISYVRFKWEAKLLNLLKFKKSTNRDYMQDIIDADIGAWMYLYLEKQKIIYYGKLVYYENSIDGKDKNIVISNFSVVTYDGQSISNHENSDEWQVILNTKDISRMEIYK